MHINIHPYTLLLLRLASMNAHIEMIFVHIILLSY